MFVHLSHLLRPEDNAYPGEPVVAVRPDREIGKDGMPFNSAVITLPNHFGTHMDAPRHFVPGAARFAELPVETFGYTRDEILVADLPHRNAPREVLVRADLDPYREQLPGKRILLLRTGFEERKFTDPHTYEYEGLSLHPDLCRFLVEECPDLVCIGMDWLSIGTPANDLGAEAHRWLLGAHTEHFVTGIEDMHLAPIGDRTVEVLTLGPLRVAGVDSAQVNAMALLAD